MSNKELAKLIERAAKGDEASFEQLMEVKAKQILYFSVKLLKNWQDGEDVAQEVMLQMYQHIGELKNPEAFNTWMYRITARICINYQKKWGKEEFESLSEKEEELNEMRREFLPQEYIEDVDKRDFLMKIIDDLPEDYRACLLLFYYEDMSYQDIAKSMNMSLKRVSNILVRAKKLIREKLERKYGSKINFSSFQGAAALPVLSQAFRLEAASQMTPEVIANLIAGSGLGTSAAAAAVQAGASAGGTAAAGGAVNTTTKILIGLVTATAAAGAAYTLIPETGVLTGRDDTAVEAVAILTLEDMIGVEKAELLRTYVEGDEDVDGWKDFLEELPVTSVYTADSGDERYTLYHMERQDKQLMILEASSEHGFEVAFHFTDRHEEAPRELEFLDSLERWRQ